MNTERKKLIKIVLAIICSLLLICAVIAVFGLQEMRKAKPQLISAGFFQNAAVRDDGSVIYSNDRGEDKTIWKDKNIVSVAVGNFSIYGLTNDRKVLVEESSDRSPAKWDDIIAISAGASHIVGVKADGTVVASGDNGHGQCNTGDWTDIVAVSAGWDFTIGLKSNGRVVATGNNEQGQCEVESWRGIIAISAGYTHTAGLKANGTVVAVGENPNGCCDTQEWRGIKSISAGGLHTVGLKADGSVVSAGTNNINLDDVSQWRSIKAISAGLTCTIGLKSDGTVVAVGENYSYTPRLTRWKGLRTETGNPGIHEKISEIINSVFSLEQINTKKFWVAEDRPVSELIIWAMSAIAACVIPILFLRFAVIRKGLTWGRALFITILWCLISLAIIVVCIYDSLCDRFILAVPIIMSVANLIILKKGQQKESPKESIVEHPSEVKQQEQRQTDHHASEPSEYSVGQELLFCHKCGAKIQADSQFCHHCGARIR